MLGEISKPCAVSRPAILAVVRRTHRKPLMGSPAVSSASRRSMWIKSSGVFFQRRAARCRPADARAGDVLRQQLVPAARDGMRINAEKRREARIAAVPQFERLEAGVEAALLFIEQAVEQRAGEVLGPVAGGGLRDEGFGRRQEGAVAGEPDARMRPEAVGPEAGDRAQCVVAAAMRVAGQVIERLQLAKDRDVYRGRAHFEQTFQGFLTGLYQGAKLHPCRRLPRTQRTEGRRPHP